MTRPTGHRTARASHGSRSGGALAPVRRGLSLALVIWAAAALLLPAPAAGRAGTAGAERMREMVHDGRSRSYLVHLPAFYSAKKKYPLVLVLHGGGGNATLTARMTGFSEKADREGFIAVYPNGTGRIEGLFLTWNAGNCCGFALDEKEDDTGFLKALLQRLKREYPVDPGRVFVTGISNGGMMSYRLACELAGEIAAIGPVAGSMNIECRPARPVSVVALHGTRDDYVRYEGGAPGVQADWHPREDRPVRETITFWARHNRCDPSPRREQKGKVTAERYAGCAEGTAVVLYTIQDEGHTWPGGRKWAFWAEEPTREVSATDVIWDFFSKHPRKP